MNVKDFSWNSVKEYGHMLKFAKRKTLFRQREKGKGFYYLDKGEVKITIIREDGYERIIDYVTPNKLLGEQGANHSSYITTAKTTCDSTLYYFSIECFQYLCRDIPIAAEAFSISLISKIRMLVNMKSLMIAPVDTQLAHYLLLLHEKYNSNKVVITKTDISNYLGKSRVTIWKLLKEWQDKHIVKVDDNSIYLNNIDKLRRFLK